MTATLNHSFAEDFASGMGVKIHRHELKSPAVFAGAPLELRLPLVRSESHGCNRTASIVNWNREPASDTKSGGLLEKIRAAARIASWIRNPDPTRRVQDERAPER